MPTRDAEKNRAAARRYYERHREEVCRKRVEAYSRNANGEREARREYYRLNREQELANNAEYYRRVRREVITAYGNRCACCGVETYEFLTFDHIAGQADKSRGEKEHGNALWMRLRREGFPQGKIQILCWNCNEAKAHYGVCPHQLKGELNVSASLCITGEAPAALC